MLADLDSALSRYLTEETLPGQSIKVELDPPTKDWASRRTGPVLNLFLADVREDLDRRTVNPRELVNDNGQVTARVAPLRFYAVTYLLTAWTATPEDDHQLLGSALIALLKQDIVPPSYIGGQLASIVGTGFSITTRIGGKTFTERMVTELMTAIGGDYRPTLSIVASIPVPTGTPAAAGPPQTAPPAIKVGNTETGASSEVRGRNPADPNAGVRTRTRPDGSPVIIPAAGTPAPAGDASGKASS
jgi:hypothetical protein